MKPSDEQTIACPNIDLSMQKEHEIVWNRCLQIIRDNVGEQTYITWFSPIKPLKFENKILTIQVPSQFFYEWLEEHYVFLLRKSIDGVIGADGRLEYSIVVDRGNAQHKPLSINIPTSKSDAKYSQSKQAKEDKSREYNGPFTFGGMDRESIETQLESQLNAQYSFETYVEGDCNRLARSAGLAVATKPGVTSFNPLMIYGGVGLGKTHLVQAIGNEIRSRLGNKLVLYVSSEKFTNQFIEALKHNNVQKFANLYLQVDVLILDDVQFLAGKEKTQEIYFHIFNHLHQSGKQIIMTSDCSPRELNGLTERLVSRFKWGLTADLQTPDFETRIAIIGKKAQNEGIHLSFEVVEYIAHNVDTNIRELEGVLISLVAHSSLNKTPIDLELAKQVLKNIVEGSESEIGIDKILKTVSDFYNLSIDDLRSKSRKQEIVHARQVAMYFAKEYTKHTLKAIGYHFGGRDHTTVIHALQSVHDEMNSPNGVLDEIDTIKSRLKGKRSGRY